jgi:3alpha(or 20beta)-hydroxysteroid dehydrogenase
MDMAKSGADGGDLAGKVAIVSGGARGIGGAVARMFVERGASVVIADMLDAEGHALAVELGEATRFQHLDVTDEDQWQAAVTAAVAGFGRVDALINCAGILITDAIVSFDRATFDKVLQVNLTGTFLGIKHAAPAMIAAGGGSITNISSTEGLQGSNSMGAYAASKWGVRGLTKVAALELGAHRTRVNSVHPGPINTPMVNPDAKPAEELSHLSLLARMPISRVADPAEVAGLCAYLASDLAAFVTAAEIAIDGGLTTGMFLPNRPGAPQR